MHKLPILLVFGLVSLSAFSFSEVKNIRFESGVDQVNKNNFSASSITATAKDLNGEMIKVNVTCQKKKYDSSKRKMVKAGSITLGSTIANSATLDDKCDEFSKLVQESNTNPIRVKLNYTRRSVEVEKL